MVPPRGAVNGTPLGGFIFIFLVLENGLSIHCKVEDESIWLEIAGGSYTRTPKFILVLVEGQNRVGGG